MSREGMNSLRDGRKPEIEGLREGNLARLLRQITL